LLVGKNIDPWMLFFHRLLSMQLDSSLEPQGSVSAAQQERLNAEPLWRLKDTVAEISFKLLSKYLQESLSDRYGNQVS